MFSEEHLCGVCFKTKTSIFHFNDKFKYQNPIESSQMPFDGQSYWDCFRYCTQIKLDLKDLVSEYICLECSKELNGVLKFLQKVKIIEKCMHQLTNINNLEVQSISNTTEGEPNVAKAGQEKALKSNETLDKETNEENWHDTCVEDAVDTYQEGLVKELYSEILLIEDESESREKSYLCPICESTFNIKEMYISHMEMHKNHESTGEPDEDFSIYESSVEPLISTKISPSSQEDSAAKDATFPCSFCPRSFDKIRAYKSHQRIHKTQRSLATTCHICSKQLTSIYSKKMHMESHKEETQLFKCNDCFKVYNTKASLTHHKRSHSNAKTLDCPECGKKFYRPSDLKIHRRFHTKDFPFICEVCGKRYAIKSHLKAHMWKHENLKVKCDVCSKLFSSNKALTDHMAFHTNKLYKCYICERQYPSKAKYKAHLLTSHGVEFYPEDDFIPGHNKFGQPLKRKKLTLVKVDDLQKEISE